MIVNDTERIVYHSASTEALPTVRLSRPRTSTHAFILLGVAARLLVCLAALWMGLAISTHSNDGVAVLAALACAGVIYGTLGRARR